MADAPRYVRPTIGGWLRPLILAPLLAAWLSALVYAFALHAGFIGPWITLGIGVAIAAVWAPLYSAVLAATDLVLLGLRMRTLPTGWRAWATAGGSALVVHAVYALIKPHSFYKMGVWGVGIALAAPMVISAVIARTAWGKRGNW